MIEAMQNIDVAKGYLKASNVYLGKGEEQAKSKRSRKW